jgi:6-phosphofructokinase 1
MIVILAYSSQNSSMKKNRIGILTGGGDAPGLNGIIESVSRVLLQQDYQVIGIRDGFEGVFNEQTFELTEDIVRGYHAEAGSLLGASNKSRVKGREQEFLSHYQNLKLDGLVAVGGDGTFSGLSNVSDGLKIIGLPKTIDNDLSGTDVTFGYDTACSVVSESVDSLRATADTHRRIIVVETMGRTAGWIALGGGLASYADVIIIPERPFSKEKLLAYVMKQKAAGRRGLLIVVSEGAFAEGESPQVAFKVTGSPQDERYGGIAQSITRWLDEKTGWESRHVVLGHLQRSRHPTTTDRFLTLGMGVEAAQMVMESAWNQAVVYRKGAIQRAPLADLMQPARLVDADHRWVKFAQALNIFI